MQKSAGRIRVIFLGMVVGIALTGSQAFSESTSAIYLRLLVVPDAVTAGNVTDRLARGEAFAWLAAECSIDPSKKRGGFVGQVKLEDLKTRVRTIVQRLKVGEVAGPIRVPEGLAFFQRTTFAYYAQAVRLMRSGKYQETLRYLDQDLELNPDRMHSIELKAYALQQLGRDAGAESLYRDLIRRDPTHVLAHNNLAALLDEAGKHDEALRLFERVVELDPTQDVALYNLGWLYATHLHDLPGAVGFMQRAIALKPEAAHYYTMLGEIYARQGRWAQARRAVSKAVALKPTDRSYRERLVALKTAGRLPQLQRAVLRQQSSPGQPEAVDSPPLAGRLNRAAVPLSMASRPAIKVVTGPGGAAHSRLLIRLFRQHGFPVHLRIDDPTPMHGIRIFHKPTAIETARKLRDLADPGSRLRRLTWESQFDVIVYVGP